MLPNFSVPPWHFVYLKVSWDSWVRDINISTDVREGAVRVDTDISNTDSSII
jgi:hypothetical protein